MCTYYICIYIIWIMMAFRCINWDYIFVMCLKTASPLSVWSQLQPLRSNGLNFQGAAASLQAMEKHGQGWSH